MADDRSRAEVLEFVDLSTLNQRMKTTDSISIEYLNYEHIWHRLKFIVIDRDKENNLRNIIFASELIDDEKRARDRFQYLAETDQLTGINNRGTGENKIKDLLFRDVGGMFILFDADHFKYVNDNFGHDVGDEVLIGIAEAMKHSFREKDILMRLGGDEFAAYTPGILNEESARHVLDRFINAVENMDIKKLNGHKISISIGAAFYFATDSFSFDELYSRADTCAYVSKKIEGSEVTFYKRKGTL
jgi:diguanylate cyclase (GGDEF)-like protein